MPIPTVAVLPEQAESEKKRAAEDYNAYEKYFVDKPIVDFISTESNFRGQQIALNLHFYAKEWLRSNFGLKLYMSTTLTPGESGGQAFYGKVKPSLNLKEEDRKRMEERLFELHKTMASETKTSTLA